MSLVSWVIACTSSEPTELPPEPEPEPERGEGVALETLSATSGIGVERIVDLDPATSWTPVPDPSEEGVQLRFEAPTVLQSVRVAGCPIADAQVHLFADGASLGKQPLHQGVAQYPVEGEVRSLYLRVLGPVGACLSEVELVGASGETLRAVPPRRVRGQITASSVLAPEAAYRPAYLFDGRTHFAWVEGHEGDGVGQRLDIQFEEPQQLRSLEIWNGYQRSDDHFAKNARLARILVTGESGSQELLVADQAGAQLLALEPPLEGSTLSIEILEVSGGQRYPDLVVSELRFHDAQGPFRLETQDLAQAEALLRKEIRGTPLENVVGRVFESRCSPRVGTLKLRRDSSFVWYGGDAEVEEVFDGAWAIERKEGPWTRVGLYGRRHRVEQSLQPATEARPVETTKVSGGTLELALARELGPRLQEELKAMGRGPTAARVGCVDSDELLHELVLNNAVLVKGTALTDLLIPQP
jgi:hypothetical protein